MEPESAERSISPGGKKDLREATAALPLAVQRKKATLYTPPTFTSPPPTPHTLLTASKKSQQEVRVPGGFSFLKKNLKASEKLQEKKPLPLLSVTEVSGLQMTVIVTTHS